MFAAIAFGLVLGQIVYGLKWWRQRSNPHFSGTYYAQMSGIALSQASAVMQVLLDYSARTDSPSKINSFGRWLLTDCYLLLDGLTAGYFSAVAESPSHYAPSGVIGELALHTLQVLLTGGVIAFAIHFFKISWLGYEEFDGTLLSLRDYLQGVYNAKERTIRVEFAGELPREDGAGLPYVDSETLIVFVDGSQIRR